MEKIIRFDIFCPVCKYYPVKDIEGAEPCDDCLAIGGREDSIKPLYFKGELPDLTKLEE